jgi:large subunit ribosomal protein L4
MAIVPVLDAAGRAAGQVTLDERVFDGIVRTEALRQTVVNYLANQRIGTASAKDRGEVSGGGKKPWRQKGTGRARAGTIRSPLWRHGGVTFGPKPREYRYAVPKKIRRLALKSSLNAKVQEERLVLVESLQLEAAKTKLLAALLTAIGAIDRALIITESPDERLVRAARNLPGILVRTADSVHPYEVLRSPKVVTTAAGLSQLVERLIGQADADAVEETPVHA